MAWAAGTLALAISVVLATIAFVSIGVLLARQMELTARASAETDVAQAARALSAAIDRVRELARHSMVVNGLVDSVGRQAYLSPFIEEDAFRARLNGTLAVCDPVGDVIASAGRQDARQPCPPIRADATPQTPGLTSLIVTESAAELFLNVSEPIVTPGTGSVEGLVMGRVSVRRVLEEAGVWKSASLLEVKLRGLTMKNGTRPANERLLRVEVAAPHTPGESGALALTMTHGVPMAPLYAPLVMVVMVFLATLITLVVLVAYFARRQASRLSVPLLRLQDAAVRASQGKPVELETALVRPDEIGVLASAVKHMADTLQGHGEELEREVSRRTAELVAAKEATERLNRELQAFAYSVAHDLKAPLRGIDGYTGLVLGAYGDRLDDAGRDYLAKVRKAAVTMGELIDDLLTHARLEQRDFEKQEVDLVDLVEGLIAEHAHEIAECGTRVDVDIAGRPVLSCDREGLMMTLRNLMTNALKFTRGRPSPRVEVGLADAGATWVLSVRDNGVGFDMRYHDKIFAIFQRLHRSEDYPGTGVGLAIVRKAVERMSGRVWAESKPGEGAAFKVELPK